MMKPRLHFLCLMALLCSPGVAAGQSSKSTCCGYKKLPCTTTQARRLAPITAPPYKAGRGIVPDPEIVRFAVIGDYGQGQYDCEGSVAQMIAQWNRESPLDFIITLGDNNYQKGATSTLKKNILNDYSAAPGAMLVVANSKKIEFCFYSIADAERPVDCYRIDSPPPCTQTPGGCTPPPELSSYCAQQPPKKAPVEPACPAGSFPTRP